ncbi:MAG: heat-inducible transcriptional repressor HrcA [Acidimicrobiales bacterium]
MPRTAARGRGSERSTPADHGDADGGLDARKAAILEAVVTEYIGTAQPVGSQYVAQAAGVRVSSATVRSEMAALEQEGYLAQPHTSAGRVPTDKGYRFFVDHLAAPGVLGPAQRQKVSRFFDHVHGEMEEMLERTSGLLTELTSYAAVVVAPGHEATAIRSVQLVGLGPRLALVVVVLADGTVDKRTLEFAADVPEGVLERAAGCLQAHVQGRSLAACDQPPPTGDRHVDAAVVAAAAALAELAVAEESDHVFVGSPSRLAGAFEAVETVRSVLAILEQQLVVVTLLRDVLSRGLSVAIGAEHGYEPLASCALVVAPVSVGGQDAGAVGLLGPTRMNYPQALAAAHVVGERLGERIGGTLEAMTAGTPGEDEGQGRAEGEAPDGGAGGPAAGGGGKGGRGART